MRSHYRGHDMAAVCLLAIVACSEQARTPTDADLSASHNIESSVHTLATQTVAKVQVVLPQYVQVGASMVARALGYDAQGALIDVSSGYSVVWSSSNSAVAALTRGATPDIEPVSAYSPGSSTICATIGAVKGCSTVVVSQVGTLSGSVWGTTSIPSAGSYTYSTDGQGGWQQFDFEWWRCPNGQRANVSGNTCHKFASVTVHGNINDQTLSLHNADGVFSLWVKASVPGQSVWSSLTVDASHALDATISAPAMLQNVSGENCTWFGHPVGGTPPYTYLWRLDGTNYYPTGSTTDINYTARLYGGSSHYAYMTVTDAAGVSYTASAYTPNSGYEGGVQWPCSMF